MRLRGKVAIITGAASGIGKATAILFAKEGARVVVVDCDPEGSRQTVEVILEGGGEAIFVEADVSRADEARRVVEEAVNAFGAVNILHNNAGIWRFGTVVDTSEEEWDRVMAINLKSFFLLSKYAIPEMLKVGGGSVINTASVGGLVGVENGSAYSASKGGVICLTRSMALDYGPHNIRVNCICPGAIGTPMLYSIARLEGRDLKEVLQAWSEERPLRKIGTPEDVAHAALYLASEESGFVTGATLVVDGGCTAM